METVTSSDGTRIAYERSGGGPPLVLVHGAAGTHSRWAPVLPALEKRFTVYAVDRRGRGESGDNEPYAIEREFEDVAAVVDSVGEPVSLLGHSFGAVCALEAAMFTRNIRRLILHEPPHPLPVEDILPDGIIDRLEALLDAGDREGVVAAFALEVMRMPAEEFEAFKTLPAGQAAVAAANTLPRELQVRYRFEGARFSGMHAPSLLLLGSESPPFYAAATETVAAALPESRIAVMPGAEHVAIYSAPEVFLKEVIGFLSEVAGGRPRRLPQERDEAVTLPLPGQAPGEL
ncbi:MAG: alpha/beta hydrolase [Trueperaceae bacterium]